MFKWRIAVWMPMLAAVVLACGPKPTAPDGGGGAGGSGDECKEAGDCGNASLFDCVDKENGSDTIKVCVPVCRTKSDCTAAVRGEYALPYCAGALGCECDQGECKSRLCSSDADCGGTLACRDGSCTALPAASAVASCRISPDIAMLRGDKATRTRFWVSLWDKNNKPVVLKDGITWSAEDTAVSVVSSKGATAEYKAAGATTANPVDGVKVTVGSVSCTAKVQVLGAPAGNKVVGVLVLDEITGRPVEGVRLALSKVDAPASALAGGAVSTKKTDVRGYAEDTVDSALTAVNVTVFDTRYDYATATNIALPSTGGTLLAFALRRNSLDKYGGYKGGYTGIPADSNAHFGLAGGSIGGALTSLSPTQLLGSTVKTNINFNGQTYKDVPLPLGLYGALGSTVFKADVGAQGGAGLCYLPSGAADETNIKDGNCGTMAAWSLSGNIPVKELPIDAVLGAANGGSFDIGKLLTRFLPLFRFFSSSVSRDLQYTMAGTKATTKPNGEVDYDLSDISHYTKFDHEFAQVPLGFDFAAGIPDLPNWGKYADSVLILGGVRVPGRGLVPLGIGAALNSNNDAKTDAQTDLGLTTPGLAKMRMAPAHHGLEGGAEPTNYFLAAAAFSLSEAQTAGAATATGTTVLYSAIEDGKIPFDAKGATPVAVKGNFLNIPLAKNNTLYNFTNTDRGPLKARQFKLDLKTGVSIADGSYIQVQFLNGESRYWNVNLDPAKAADGFILPNPADYGMSDRTLLANDLAKERSDLKVNLLRLVDPAKTANGGVVTYAEAMEFTSQNASRHADLTTGYSLAYYGKPRVSFKTPDAAGKTIAKESNVVVSVSYFKVGDVGGDGVDGWLRLSIDGGTGCSNPVDVKTAASAKGEVTVKLPVGCSGAVTLRATLVGLDGQPVAPAVTSTVATTIQ